MELGVSGSSGDVYKERCLTSKNRKMKINENRSKGVKAIVVNSP
jgi:hypothetical protein